MKVKYEAPTMIQVTLHTKHLFSLSDPSQNVYTDDPQDVSNALIKENSTKNVWDDEW